MKKCFTNNKKKVWCTIITISFKRHVLTWFFTNSILIYPPTFFYVTRGLIWKRHLQVFLTTLFINTDALMTLFLATVCTCALEISNCQNTALFPQFIKLTLELYLLSLT